MSLKERIKANSAARVLVLLSGWRIEVRNLLPEDFLLHSADDVKAWLVPNQSDLMTLEAISKGGAEAEEILEEWRAETSARAQDPEIVKRWHRLQKSAVLASVVGLAAPGEEIEPTRIIDDGEDVPVESPTKANPNVITLRTLMGILGQDGYAEAADLILWRAVGGEAGQKVALAFRDFRSTFGIGKNRKGAGGPPQQPVEGEHSGSPDRPDLLGSSAGGEGKASQET